MLTRTLSLMNAYTTITRSQWQEIDDLLMGVCEELPRYASGEYYEWIMRWAQEVDSRDALWVLHDALRGATMPPSPKQLALAVQSSDVTLAVDYISIAHRLGGQTYTASDVLAALRGMRDSPVTSGIDFTTEDGLVKAAVMVRFMRGLAGSFLVASGNVGGDDKLILFGAEIAEMVLENPDRVDDVIRFVKDRRQVGQDDETEAIIANDPSDINAVMLLVDRRNSETTKVIREMLDSDLGVLVDGML